MSVLSLSKQEQALLATLDEAYETMRARLHLWASQNSGSCNRQGLSAMRALLKEAYQELPGRCEEIPLPSSQVLMADGRQQTQSYEPALRLSIRPEAPVQVALTGHYDTVFDKDSPFQSVKILDEDHINGPGVADMKGGLIVMLEALKVLEKSDQRTNIGYTVLVSPDEETGSLGSAPLLAELGRRAHLGLTYEPALADGRLAGARKGSGNFALIIRGRAAHAGREPHLGRNAIAAMARFIVGLENLNGQCEGVSFNIAKIDGGGANNIVPDLAIGRFNVRMCSVEDTDWIMRELDRLVKQIHEQEGYEAYLHGDFMRPPKPMSKANLEVFSWVRQAGAALGQNISWASSGGVCEGNNLWAAGCANVDTLGVLGGHIHSDKEFMQCSSLVERAGLSALVLMKLASGEFDAISVKKMVGV